MRFIDESAPHGWYPKPGELVEGRYSGRLIRGTVLSGNKPTKPRVFSRGGFVALYVMDDYGRARAINQVRPVGGYHGWTNQTPISAAGL